MNRTVWKFPLTEPSPFSLRLPVGAKVLHVAEQHGTSTLWAEVACDDDFQAAFEERTFYVVGTGDRIPDEAGSHVATWFDDPFVWHLYAPKLTYDGT